MFFNQLVNALCDNNLLKSAETSRKGDGNVAF